jgi:hypothetical protein
MAKTKRVESSTLVYCGPSIPGVVKQYTFFRNGLPAPLAEAIEKNPVIGELVIKLELLPDAMRQLRAGSGPIYSLYCLVQVKI